MNGPLRVAGFGTTALESLPGRVGTQDVADVVAATKAALALEPEALDPSKVGVVGGSHGGFLGAHLTAQRPEIFKAAALRNPVSKQQGVRWRPVLSSLPPPARGKLADVLSD